MTRWRQWLTSPYPAPAPRSADHEAISAYLAALTDELKSFTPGERMAGVDQGVHNILLHTNQIQNVTIHDNTGPILTLGYVKGDPATNEHGEVINENGVTAHIVHQYDRKPALFKYLRSQFAGQPAQF